MINYWPKIFTVGLMKILNSLNTKVINVYKYVICMPAKIYQTVDGSIQNIHESFLLLQEKVFFVILRRDR